MSQPLFLLYSTYVSFIRNYMTLASRTNKGMVFGVFDHLHAGHRFFLETAARHCVTLVVVVTQNEIVRQLKGRAPEQSLDTRMTALRKHNSHWHIVAGDATPGKWGVITEHTPDIIFLGQDQHALKEALREHLIPIRILDAHEPHIYKSSLLRKTI